MADGRYNHTVTALTASEVERCIRLQLGEVSSHLMKLAGFVNSIIIHSYSIIFHLLKIMKYWSLFSSY